MRVSGIEPSSVILSQRKWLKRLTNNVPKVLKEAKKSDQKGVVMVYGQVTECHLRFCKTAITWLRSLSAILPLFWRHGIANFPAFAAKTWEMLLWRHEIHDVFPRNMANALKKLAVFHHFTMKFDIFSLNSTWDSDFLILYLRTQNKLSVISF